MRDRSCVQDGPDTNGLPGPCLGVEVWTYRPGDGRFVATMRFEDGSPVRIDHGDRYPEPETLAGPGGSTARRDGPAR